MGVLLDRELLTNYGQISAYMLKATAESVVVRDYGLVSLHLMMSL